MKVFNIKGQDYELRNEGSEITLGELSKISNIMENKDKDNIEKWLEALTILGSKELVEVLSASNFAKAVESVQLKGVDNAIVDELVIGGRVYRLDLVDGKIDLHSKDLAKIESIVKKGGSWGAKAFAVVYKDIDLTKNEHWNDEHIKHKTKIFSNEVTADIASPVIFELGKLIVEYSQMMVDAQSTTV